MAQGYRGKLAINRIARRSQEAKLAIKLEMAMCHRIDSQLKQYLSSEQILGRLQLELGVKISHQTIYSYIWADKKNGCDLHNYLRRQGERYRAQDNK